MANGYLDRYTASVGEMIHYLYAFTKNYDGVKKWMLIDWPYKIMQHYGDWNKGDVTRVYEERFGLYYYDGTPAGRPKPIVHALAILWRTHRQPRALRHARYRARAAFHRRRLCL